MTPNIWWLSSYPKSGNTWLRAVVATLISGRPSDINDLSAIGFIASSRHRFELALDTPSSDLTLDQETLLRPRAHQIWAAKSTKPLYCKVHDACHRTSAGEPLFSPDVTRGGVYVIRDPRAVAVSLAHHLGVALDEAIAIMNDHHAELHRSNARFEEQLPQSLLRWSDHVESWLAAPFPVHVMRYEDMHANPHVVFALLANFLSLPCTPAVVAAAVEATQFSRLQDQERRSGFVENSAASGAFFREGRIDAWRYHLRRDQADFIVEAHGDVMERFGYDLSVAPFESGEITKQF